MRWLFLCALIAAPANALTAARTIPAGTVLGPQDVIVEGEEPNPAIGMQTRMTLYEGRKINTAQLQSPILVHRNDLVTVWYRKGGIEIATEARALEPGALGERIRLMNLQSRNTISGYVDRDGSIATTLPEVTK